MILSPLLLSLIVSAFSPPKIASSPARPTTKYKAARHWNAPARYRGVSTRTPPRYFTEKVCALTFDDGPSRQITPSILKILKQENVPATFFVMGSMVSENGDLLKKEVAAGYAIGIHTYDHRTHPTRGQASREMSWCEAGLIKTLGAKQQTWLFRSPYGNTKSAYTREAIARGYANILWSNSSADTATHSASVVYNNVVSNIEPGQVIICHDSEGKGHTVNALANVIRGLRKKGYSFVTVPVLLQKWDAVASHPPTPKKKIEKKVLSIKRQVLR